MSYPRQESVNARLHKETLNSLEDTGSNGLKELTVIWKHHRKELQLAVMNAYRFTAPNGRWTMASFKSHAEPMLAGEIRGILERFRAMTSQTIKVNLNGLYKESCLRYAWMLDQLTPPKRNVKIPHRLGLHEAAVTDIYYGAQASKAWTDKWSAWVDSYGSALLHNITLGASNQGPVSDAVAEVDATKSNTPQSTIFDAMSRLHDYAATEAMVEGSHTIADMNDDAEEEIWKTRGDLNICEDCEANEGVPIDEADGTIPMHPNCHCYPMLVPKSYADLLRSGDADDWELARDMDSRGIVPNSLVIRDDDGSIGAKAIVSFSRWAKGEGMAVTAQ